MARKRRKREEPKLPSDTLHPTQHRFQHDIIERAQASRGAASDDSPPLRVVSENQLSTLLSKGHLTARQHDTGARLYREWRLSGAEARMTGQYEMVIRGQPVMTDRQANYFAYVKDALDAVGHMASFVLMDVCCYNFSPAEWARKRRHPARAGIVFLKEALGYLEHHYRGRR